MICSVTLSSEDFRKLHNAKCTLRSITQKLDEVLLPSIMIDLHGVYDSISSALESAYEQETETYNRLNKHYESFATEHRLRSTWSIYNVSDLNAPCSQWANVNIERLVYDDHWGDCGAIEVDLPQEQLTWGQLWILADQLIQRSEDNHHHFIEQFQLVKQNDQYILKLRTGS